MTAAIPNALAQSIRIALPGFRKFDDLICYCLLTCAVSGAQGNANLFERDA